MPTESTAVTGTVVVRCRPLFLGPRSARRKDREQRRDRETRGNWPATSLQVHATASSAARTRDAKTLAQVVADAEGIGHDRQGRVHGSARREEAAVDDVQIVDFVRLAVDVERGRLRIAAESDGAVLVRHARQRNSVSNKQVAGHEMRVTVDVLEEVFELPNEPFMALAVVRRVAQHDVSVPIQRDAVVWHPGDPPT